MVCIAIWGVHHHNNWNMIISKLTSSTTGGLIVLFLNNISGGTITNINNVSSMSHGNKPSTTHVWS